MKGRTAKKIEHHIAKHRKAGGRMESPEHGDNDAVKDLKDKPEARTNAKKIDDEAEEMHAKRGGRAKHKRGGEVKHVGKVEGEKAMHHAGRRARKSGGTCESSPFTTANKGEPARGRKLEKETMGADA